MNKEKSNRPRTELCGTSQVSGSLEEITLSTGTACFRASSQSYSRCSKIK